LFWFKKIAWQESAVISSEVRFASARQAYQAPIAIPLPHSSVLLRRGAFIQHTEGGQKYPRYYPFLQITVTSLIFNQFLQILAYFVY